MQRAGELAFSQTAGRSSHCLSAGSVLHNDAKNKSNKNNKNTKRKTSKRSQPRAADTIPSLGPAIRSGIASGLRSLGGLAGGYIGGPAGAATGANAGAWVSKLIGAGDYTVESNSILKGVSNGVPQFSTSNRSMRISHREYLGDLQGTVAFSNQAYVLQPGSTLTFPWLSSIAAGFQQYRFHGLVFCFNSTSSDALNSTNTALGTVIMGTQYNSTLPNFTSKLEMEGYEFSCSGRPSSCLMHPVECALKETPLEHLYLRTGSIPAGQDARLYDLGVFQFATVGMQAAATIGELWVTYDIEFYKPRLAPGGSLGGIYGRINNGPYIAASEVLGTIQKSPVGNLPISVSSVTTGWDSILFPPSLTAGRYFVQVMWTGASGATIVDPGHTLSNCTLVPTYELNLGTNWLCPPAGASSSLLQWSGIVTINGYNAVGSTITFGSSGTLPAGPLSVDIYVIQLPGSDTYV